MGTQIANEFLGNEFDIRASDLRPSVSQDYYNMLHDNRLSMQKAMVDVPQFGPNIMPSQFSHFFIADDESRFGGLTDAGGAALFANGIIDQYGLLVDGKNLDEIDITAINYDTFETAFESSFNDDSDDAKRMKQFLFEQLRYFEDSRDLDKH